MFKLEDNKYFLDTSDILKIFKMAIVKDVETFGVESGTDFDGNILYSHISLFYRNIFLIPKSDTESLNSIITIIPNSGFLHNDCFHAASFFISDEPKEDVDCTVYVGEEFVEFVDKYIFFRQLERRGITVKLQDVDASYFKLTYL